MDNQQKELLPQVHGLFPTPIWTVNRAVPLSSLEEQQIEEIIKEGLVPAALNSASKNTYIFNNNLKELEQFCERQIKQYVNKIIVPEKEFEFYITQSWLNLSKPGESHNVHFHPNSIISGVFYIATEEDDDIQFQNPLHWPEPKGFFQILSESKNWWNSKDWTIPAIKNQLLLFPSWLRHRVLPNKNARKDRISISFNTFVRGTFGNKIGKTELILK